MLQDRHKNMHLTRILASMGIVLLRVLVLEEASQ